MKTKLITLLFAIVVSIGTVFATEGALPGLFSVSAEKKVQFSRGNLQYQASTDTWRFAENQYDTIGAPNANISSSYSGWIDLFGWGTGNNPTIASTDYNDYSVFADWGTNAISNGGNEVNLWRTLTSDEWGYLFQSRTNASALYGHSIVNGKNGMIILPDDWQSVEDINFIYGTGDYSQNSYTLEQWRDLESAGAVFLPATGYRSGTGVRLVGSDGNYWSTATRDENYAYFSGFNSNNLRPQNYSYRSNGRSVRLIQDYTPCILASGTCGAQGDNLTWELSCDSVLTISGTGAMADFSYYTQPWHVNRDSIKSVIIEDGITCIGKYAFDNCRNLISIEIPNSITSIESYAFNNCSGLTSITIPNSITSIGDWGFSGCSSLTSFEIPNSVTSIGDRAFEDCSNLTSPIYNANVFAYMPKSYFGAYTIPDGVKLIAGSAFSGCSGLTSVTIPNSVTSIGESAFSACSSLPVVDNIRYADWYLVEIVDRTLTSCTIKDGTKFIGSWAFQHCGSLTSIEIPSSVTSIDMHAFQGCKGLTSVTIPNSVISIGEHAFADCTGLISVTIGESVTNIGIEVFSHCNSLTSISVEAGNHIYDSRDNCNGIIKTASNTLVVGCSNTIIPNTVTSIESAFLDCWSLTSVNIPNSVKDIGEYAFGFSSLTSVTIPNSVTSIGENAFYWCNDMVSITIGDHVTSIGKDAFYECYRLTYLTIPNSVVSIDNSAFAFCKSLASLTIGNSVTRIEKHAFGCCDSLASITCEAVNPPALGEDVFFNVDKSIPLYVPSESIDAYQAADQWKDFTNIRAIGSDALDPGHPLNPGNYRVTLTVDDEAEGSVSGSGMYPHGSEVTLTATPSAGYEFVSWSDGVTDNPRTITVMLDTTIGTVWRKLSYTVTFLDEDGTQLSQQIVEHGSAATAPEVEVPQCRALAWDTDFSNVTSDLTVTAVWSALPLASGTCGAQGDNLTWELSCDSVLTISGTGAMADWNVDAHAPWNEYNSFVKTIVIADGVTNIGDFAFYGCQNMIEVTIPNSVTTLGVNSFQNCEKMTSIQLPETLTAIGSSAFYICYGLTEITIPEGVTVISNSSFRGCTSLTRVVMSDAVNVIQYAAFRDCHSLTDISLSDNLQQIHGEVFYNCRSLPTITIPSRVDSIGSSVLYGCDVISSITSEAVTLPRLGVSAFNGVELSIPVNVPCQALEAYQAAGQWSEFTNIQAISSIIASGTCGAEGDNLTWELLCDSVLTISGTGAMADFTNSNQPWYENRGIIKSVMIEDDVTSIGNHAFFLCNSLTSVVIGNSVTSIGDFAFYTCRRLASITIPNSVTSIGGSAFCGCVSLTSVTIPKSVTSIGGWALSDCYNLTSMSVEAGNPVYDSRNNCNAIIETATNTLVAGCQNTVIPNSVTSIGSTAFFLCRTLVSITIPNNVTSIGMSAFRACSTLTSVDIPGSVTTIGMNAFNGCSAMTAITCEAVTPPTMGDAVFYEVDKSIPLYVPAESVDAYKTAEQWKDFTNIQAIPCILASGTCGAEGDNLTWEISCDSVLTITGSGAMAYLNIENEYKESIKSVIIGDGVTSIGNVAFAGYSSLTSVTIGNSVTSIGELAFSGCSSLTSVTIGDSVISIGEWAFYQCSGLTSVTIGNSVTSIGKWAFEGCSSLTSVTIPNSVTDIGDVAFALCSGLTSVTIPNSVKSIGDGAFYYCSGLTSVTIGNSVTSIGENAFENCTSLTSVTIPNSVTSIGQRAFYNCTGLTSVTIGNSITNFRESVFSNCTGLTTVTINDGATIIGIDAFDHCTSLTSVTIPNSVSSIGEYAFFECFSLTSVTIPNSLTSIKSSTFDGCSSIASISVGAGNPVFDSRENCNAIIETASNTLIMGCQNTVIPSSVTSIEWEAFSGCSGLTSVTIPNSVTSIGNGAFYGCSSLTSITCEATTPPTLGSGVFYDVDKSIPVYVPCASIESYKAAEGWSDFTNYQAADSIHVTYSITSSSDLVGTVSITNKSEYCDRIELSIQATEKSGYEFAQWSDGVTSSTRTITVTGDTTITAEWIKVYTITWKDADGTTLATDTVREGTTPAYSGETPTKAADAQYTYTFNGWAPDIVAAEADATYTATYLAVPNLKLALAAIAPQCYPVNEIDVAYTAANADTITYSVKRGDDVMIDATKIKISASGMFTINVKGFAAGEYTIEAYATSALGNVSETVAQTFSIYGAMNVDESATICQGDSLLWHGQWLRDAATYYDTVRYSGSICDSICYSMNLSVAEKYEFEETYPILETELPYTVHGCTYTKAGTFDCGFTTVNGCDSIYHITIVVLTTGEDSLSVEGVIPAESLDLGVNSAVTINPQGHLVVSSPVYVQKLTLDYSDAHHAQVTGIGNIHAEVVEVLLNFPTPIGPVIGHWYSFAVPFEVSVATGIRLADSDTPARYGYDFVIDEYDGIQRATLQHGWKRVGPDAILRPGCMYMFASAKDATSWILTAADPSEIIEHTEADISENSSAIGSNHSGWNGIANPMFANATADMSGVTLITTYNNVLGVYEICEVSEFVFMPSTPFLVQVAESATFGFNDIPLFAPSRAQADDGASVFSKLMLTDAAETYTDKAYISFVTDKEEDTYLIGHDLQKMQANSQYVHQLWLEAYGMQLSAYEAPLGDEPRSIPIGIYAPEAGNYTLQMSNVPENISISLTENGQPVWDIAASAYTLNLPAGNSNSYALYVQRVPEVTTDYRTGNVASVVQKVIMDDQIFIIRNGKTYNVTGIQIR